MLKPLGLAQQKATGTCEWRPPCTRVGRYRSAPSRRGRAPVSRHRYRLVAFRCPCLSLAYLHCPLLPDCWLGETRVTGVVIAVAPSGWQLFCFCSRRLALSLPRITCPLRRSSHSCSLHFGMPQHSRV